MSHSRKPLSRRTFLRGAGGVALALPILDAMMPRSARAQMAASPRRIMFVFQANGDQVAFTRMFDDVRAFFGAFTAEALEQSSFLAR